MTSPTQDRGKDWEDFAARQLEAAGLQTLHRGYRCRGGELDLICRDGDTLVIVEVRSRRSPSHGGAIASVGPTKQRRIRFATRHFLMKSPQLAEAPIRFDVVAIDSADPAAPAFEWIRNAFDGT